MSRPVIIDNINFKLNLKDSAAEFLSDVSKEGAYLETVMRATHSGQLMKDRVYSGIGLKKGIKYWYNRDAGGLSEFDKPILKNHDANGEPLGRVVFADYVALKDGKDWEQDYKNPDSGPGKYGSGYSLLTAHVKDQDAIVKISDGRYKTLSTFQIPVDAYCSICGTSFMRGECEHEIGKYYPMDEEDKEALCYFITGEMRGVECSIVNTPRQENAIITGFKKIGDQKDGEYLIVSESSVDSDICNIYALKDGVSVDLTKDLPMTSVLTGKIKVYMKDQVVKSKVDLPLDTKDETPAKKKYDAAKFKLLNNARLLKDKLDMQIDLKDLYESFWGISENTDGHAHTYYVSIMMDKDGKLEMVGNTNQIGQGKSKYHCHSVHSYGGSIKDFKGPMSFRDANYGPTHNHKFELDMGDKSESCSILGKFDNLKAEITEFNSCVDSNLLDSEHKLESEICYDREAIADLLPFIAKDEDRFKIIAKLCETKDKSEKRSEDMIGKETVDSVIKELLKAKDTAETKNAELVQLLADKEKEKLDALSKVSALEKSVIEAKALAVFTVRSTIDSTIISNKEDEIKNLSVKSIDELDAMFADSLSKLSKKEEVTPPAKKVDISKEVIDTSLKLKDEKLTKKKQASVKTVVDEILDI